MDVQFDVAKTGDKLFGAPASCAPVVDELNTPPVSATPATFIDFEALGIQQSSFVVAARRIICRDTELEDAVPIICDGWAASVIMLSDGSRQILSFLLPGDLVSAALLFDPGAHCSVEAI